MIQAELFQGNLIYTIDLSTMLNNFPSMSLLIHSTVQQKVGKNAFLTSLRHMHFRGMTAGFLSCHWNFIALHSVL